MISCEFSHIKVSSSTSSLGISPRSDSMPASFSACTICSDTSACNSDEKYVWQVGPRGVPSDQ